MEKFERALKIKRSMATSYDGDIYVLTSGARGKKIGQKKRPEGIQGYYSNYGSPYGPPVVSAQPAAYQTPVIVQQPGPGGPGGPQRDWDSGIFDCFEDFGICLCGTFCGLCLLCQVSSDMGESVCVPCCVSNPLGVLRVKWRTQHNIQGSVMGDCVDICCCGYCVLCQLAREVKTYGKSR
ncbi:placenta-specific gene 8 protein [Elysia marginata]|uniref:Placenta-specific gene 8 protein n=1 Tax=Elysia marginata TaxID=1093978 RepID=A0AAV4I4E7_9GAST|nr:placenta-specific gene 8 protein [Elysia marginata]